MNFFSFSFCFYFLLGGIETYGNALTQVQHHEDDMRKGRNIRHCHDDSSIGTIVTSLRHAKIAGTESQFESCTEEIDYMSAKQKEGKEKEKKKQKRKESSLPSK